MNMVVLNPDDTLSDEALMRAFCAGDSQACAVLFDRYAKQLQLFLTRSTGNAALADDLTQAAFLSVVRSRHRMKDRFRPWLYAIAVNALNDHFRRHRRELLEGAHEAARAEPSSTPREEDPALQDALRRALQRLPANQRDVVVLQRFGGFSFTEIAVMVGASETAVKVRAHRATARLRTLLQKVWDDYA